MVISDIGQCKLEELDTWKILTQSRGKLLKIRGGSEFEAIKEGGLQGMTFLELMENVILINIQHLALLWMQELFTHFVFVIIWTK